MYDLLKYAKEYIFTPRNDICHDKTVNSVLTNRAHIGLAPLFGSIRCVYVEKRVRCSMKCLGFRFPPS